MALFGGSLFFFMAAMLTSALGVMTLLLRGFEPDVRLAIAGRIISDVTMTLLLLLFYLPPWIVIMGFGTFVRRY